MQIDRNERSFHRGKIEFIFVKAAVNISFHDVLWIIKM